MVQYQTSTRGFIYWSALVPTAAHGTNIKVKPKSATWRTQQSVAVCIAVPDAENARTRATVASTDGDHGCSERWSPVAMSTMGPGEHLFHDVPIDSPAERLMMPDGDPGTDNAKLGVVLTVVGAHLYACGGTRRAGSAESSPWQKWKDWKQHGRLFV